MASIRLRGPPIQPFFHKYMQVRGEFITAVGVTYGDAHIGPVADDDAVVGRMAIENLVQGFLNPINALSPPALLPNHQFRIRIGGSISAEVAIQLLDLIQTVAENTRNIEVGR